MERVLYGKDLDGEAAWKSKIFDFQHPIGGFTVLAGPPGLPRREGAGEEPAPPGRRAAYKYREPELKPFGRIVPSVEAETSGAGNRTTPHSDPLRGIMIFVFLSFFWEICKRPPFL